MTRKWRGIAANTNLAPELTVVVIAVDCVLDYSIGVDGDIVVAGLEVELDHIAIPQLVLHGDKTRKNGNEYHSALHAKKMPYKFTVQPINMLIKNPSTTFMRLHCTCTHFLGKSGGTYNYPTQSTTTSVHV